MARKTTVIPLHSPSPGTSRSLHVHRYGQTGARPKVYIHAALHADEWPGLLALHHLISMLDQADAEDRIKGEIILLPYANPIGLSQRLGGVMPGRFEIGGGGNFNRGWPVFTDNIANAIKGKLTDRTSENVAIIRQALIEAVDNLPRHTELAQLRATLLSHSIDSDYVLDVHCDSTSELHIYAIEACRDNAIALGAELSSPVVLLEKEPQGGCFDETHHVPWFELQKYLDLDPAIARTCFAATIELRGQADVNDTMAQADAAGILKFLTHKSVVAQKPDGPPIPHATPQCEATPLDGIGMINAPATGIIAWKCEIGTIVKEGDLIAELVDICTTDPATARTPLFAPTGGRFFARQTETLVHPGDNIGKIAGNEIFEGRTATEFLTP